MDPDLLHLLDSPKTQVLALAPTGAATVALPEQFRDMQAEELQVDAPLNLFPPDSRSRVVAAFEQARRTGQGSAVVATELDDKSWQLTIYDLEDIAGCFLVAMTPAVHEMSGPSASPAVPRQATMSMSADGVIISVDDDFEKMLEYNAGDIVGRSSLEIIHPDDHDEAISAWVLMLDNPGPSARIRQRLLGGDGNWYWCEITDVNHLGDPDRPRVDAEILDIAGEMKAQQALQRRETLLDRLQQALPTGVMHLDVDGAVTFWNERWVELTGVTGGNGAEGLLDTVDDPIGVRRSLADASADGIDVDLAVELSGPGLCRFGELHFRRLEHDGRPFGLLITLDDVTRLKTDQLKLANQTRTDMLTGIHNRFGIEELLVERLDANHDCTVLFFDLDDFKRINDGHGHRFGDEVLRVVAKALGDAIRPEDAIGRLGGDEFLAVLEGPLRAQDLATIISRIERIGVAVTELCSLPAPLGISVGLAHSGPADDIDAILKRADQAMYEQKRIRRRTTYR